jgi:hypothetical protein
VVLVDVALEAAPFGVEREAVDAADEARVLHLALVGGLFGAEPVTVEGGDHM